MAAIPSLETRAALSYRFDRRHLLKLARGLRSRYVSADPFPHVVIDDFLPPELLDAVLAEFPGPDAEFWRQFKEATQLRKQQCSDPDLLGEVTEHLLSQFNSRTAIQFLEELTGIEGLVPDPHFKGGGIHQTLPGGMLKMHADFNKHDALNLDRRLNLLLYLNRDWKDEYGGHLELWDREMKRCVVKVAPVFNRCVVFSTTSESFHGHPDPLRCPEGRTRRSLALYYYTNGRPEDELRSKHTTLFKARPGEEFKDPPQKWHRRLRDGLKKLVRRKGR